MEKAFKLEDLEVYKEALLLVKEIFQICRSNELKREDWLKNQIKRSSTSVAVNISEGYGRKSKADFSHFLSIALGSCNETRSFLDIIETNYSTVQTEDLKERYIILGRRIYTFRKRLEK